ncbi:MAG: 2-dehydropantoate 2-reductase [Candidatus Lokiarchaeota archaeon]|nr:2-dehydropantoate 2-reductase [Candidatus Lokiarchaeota archaeon]
MDDNVTIFILGMGAIGSLFAAVLHSNGQKIVGLCRGLQYKEIVERGLTYIDLEKKLTVIPTSPSFQATQNLSIEEVRFQDWIFVTSKIYNLEEILRNYVVPIKHLDSIVLAQNGIGNEEIVQRILPNLRIYRILTTNGALLEKPGLVRHTGRGYTKIGYPQINTKPLLKQQCSSLINILNHKPFYGEMADKIDVLLWEKIFINIGINALASIHNIPNGGLIKSRTFKEIMKQAIIEAWRVARAMKIQVNGSPDRYIEFTYQVCANTKLNRNSMLQDLDKGHKTEIDFINGKIVEYGKTLGITTPINEDLTQQIKEMERKSYSNVD